MIKNVYKQNVKNYFKFLPIKKKNFCIQKRIKLTAIRII